MSVSPEPNDPLAIQSIDAADLNDYNYFGTQIYTLDALSGFDEATGEGQVYTVEFYAVTEQGTSLKDRANADGSPSSHSFTVQIVDACMQTTFDLT